VKTGARLYLSSTLFGFVIALAYWLWTRELFGTIILGLLGTGLAIVYGFLLVRQRRFILSSDDPEALAADESGEPIETFASRSPWPLAVAAGALLTLLPLIYAPYLSLGGLALLLYALYGMMQEIMPRRASASDAALERADEQHDDREETPLATEAPAARR
jgi:hypothetical protein